MHHEMGKMLVQGNALLDRLALDRFAGQRDVAQNAGDRAERLDLGEAEHVGGAVLAAPLLVELVLLGVVGEQDRQLGCTLELGFGLLEGFEYGALGQRIEILRPGVIIADNGNLERGGAQRDAPSIALSASRLAVSAS